MRRDEERRKLLCREEEEYAPDANIPLGEVVTSVVNMTADVMAHRSSRGKPRYYLLGCLKKGTVTGVQVKFMSECRHHDRNVYISTRTALADVSEVLRSEGTGGVTERDRTVGGNGSSSSTECEGHGSDEQRSKHRGGRRPLPLKRRHPSGPDEGVKSMKARRTGNVYVCEKCDSRYSE